MLNPSQISNLSKDNRDLYFLTLGGISLRGLTKDTAEIALPHIKSVFLGIAPEAMTIKMDTIEIFGIEAILSCQIQCSQLVISHFTTMVLLSKLESFALNIIIFPYNITYLDLFHYQILRPFFFFLFCIK